MRIRTIVLPLTAVVSLVLCAQAFALNPQPLPPGKVHLSYSIPPHNIIPPCVHHPYTCV